MAMPETHILCIRVLEDSAECGVFVVNVYCGEPLLLRFWSTKPAFRSVQVEQMGVSYKTSMKMDFVLRVVRRVPNLPNTHYWGPFVLALCLDALHFRFRLPAQAECGVDIQRIMKQHGKLTLLR
ncbi:hypothetical protein AMECASPLE_010092 [Ameca splendens]|uniref:Uncharacterized protein n=1 Tax=Ameca splendens TaxID=208324 RepID=A0ABV0XDE8_9TELE